MEENARNEIDLMDFFKSIDWKKAVKWCLASAVIGIVIAFSLPKEYTTTIEFAPESNSKSQSQLPSMGGLGALMGMSGIGNMSSSGNDGVSMRIYPRIVESTPFLMEFYDMEVQTKSGSKPLNLYLEEDIRRPWWSYIMGLPSMVLGIFRSGDKGGSTTGSDNPYVLTGPERRFVQTLKNRLDILLDEDTWTVKLSAQMQDPFVAAVTADSMMTTLQRYMSDYYQSRARASLANTQRAYDEAYENYLQAQHNFAEAVDSNKSLAVEKAKIRLTLLENEYNVAYTAYQQIANQLSLAKLKLQEDNHIATVIEPAMVNTVPTSKSKPFIIVVFTILGACAYVGILFAKFMLKPAKQDHTTQQTIS